MLVVGAGVIGLELGSVWRASAPRSTVVEFLDRILPGMDNEIARQFQRIQEKQGVKFRLGTKVTGVDTKGKTLKLRSSPRPKAARARRSKPTSCSSRSAAFPTPRLGLAEAGVELDKRGRASSSTSIIRPMCPAFSPSAT
jgi:dihydrolipoamide dehydrogenase